MRGRGWLYGHSLSQGFAPFRSLISGQITKGTLFLFFTVLKLPFWKQIRSWWPQLNGDDQTGSHSRINYLLLQHQVNSGVGIAKPEVRCSFACASFYIYVYPYVNVSSYKYKCAWISLCFRWNVTITGLSQKILLHMGISQWRCWARRSTRTGCTAASGSATWVERFAKGLGVLSVQPFLQLLSTSGIQQKTPKRDQCPYPHFTQANDEITKLSLKIVVSEFLSKVQVWNKSSTRALDMSVVPIITDEKCVNFFFSLSQAHLLAINYAKLQNTNGRIANIFQKGNSAIIMSTCKLLKQMWEYVVSKWKLSRLSGISFHLCFLHQLIASITSWRKV